MTKIRIEVEGSINIKKTNNGMEGSGEPSFDEGFDNAREGFNKDIKSMKPK